MRGADARPHDGIRCDLIRAVARRAVATARLPSKPVLGRAAEQSPPLRSESHLVWQRPLDGTNGSPCSCSPFSSRPNRIRSRAGGVVSLMDWPVASSGERHAPGCVPVLGQAQPEPRTIPLPLHGESKHPDGGLRMYRFRQGTHPWLRLDASQLVVSSWSVASAAAV